MFLNFRCCPSGNIILKDASVLECKSLSSGIKRANRRFQCNNGVFKSQPFLWKEGRHEIRTHDEGKVSFRKTNRNNPLPFKDHDHLEKNSTDYCVCIYKSISVRRI